VVRHDTQLDNIQHIFEIVNQNVKCKINSYEKVAQNVANSLSNLIVAKIKNEPPKVAQLGRNWTIWSPLRRHDIQHNDTQYIDIQHNGLICYTINDIQCNVLVSLCCVLRPLKCRYAECLLAECHYAECHYAECRYAECRYAECRYAECRYAECRYSDCCDYLNVMLSVATLSVGITLM
jgi:hypothetical protein